MKVSISNIAITGIASVLPSKSFEISELSSIYGLKKIKRIIKSTGVERVRLVESGVTAADLCVKAAETLMAKLGIGKESIDGIIFVSISPDYKAPATSVIMQHRLGLNKNAVAFDINYGCSAFIYGLYQASMLINSGGCKCVLLCNGDTQSGLINKNDKAMKMIVGDAGAATIIEQGDYSINFVIKSDGLGYQHLIIPAGGTRNPFSEETSLEVQDDDGNIRSQNDLYMNGMEVMRFALKEVPKIIDEILEMTKWLQEDVGTYAFHQPNKLILDYLRDELKISEEVMPVSLKNTGNTASPSIPLMLTIEHTQLQEKNCLNKVVACGFGIGLSWGAATIDLSKTIILDPLDY